MATSCLDLQKQIFECETRMKTYTDILQEDELVLSSIEHELTRLDGVIESLEQCLWFVLTQRQTCEEVDAKY
jgi:hypothetical protein